MTDYGAVDPVMLEFPESFDTERLTIRSPQWGDGADVNEAIRESVKRRGRGYLLQRTFLH